MSATAAGLIGVAWVLMLATLAMLGYVLVHFTARIDALEEELDTLRPRIVPVDGSRYSPELGFVLEEDVRP